MTLHVLLILQLFTKYMNHMVGVGSGGDSAIITVHRMILDAYNIVSLGVDLIFIKFFNIGLIQ